jgi:hypothetical protein
MVTFRTYNELIQRLDVEMTQAFHGGLETFEKEKVFTCYVACMVAITRFMIANDGLEMSWIVRPSVYHARVSGCIINK